MNSRDEARTWLHKSDIQGVGIGAKITGGYATGVVALRVYVDEKRPLADLDVRVPRAVDVPAVGQVPTDVIEIGELVPELFRERLRPASPGVSVGQGNTVGTFGCLVRRADGSPGTFILSNSHVLARSGLADIGDDILQPAREDGAAATDVIAKLAAFVPFDYTPDGFPNTVDAAIADVSEAALTAAQIRLIAITPTRVSAYLRRGMRVHKVGRTTDHTWGVVNDIDFRPQLPYPDPANPGDQIKIGFRNQVLCSRYTEKGDSGALVLSSTNAAVGMHFAGSKSASAFHRIGDVFDALGIELEA